MKKWWIQIFIIPNLRSAAAYLRTKDENDTGIDDEAAAAIDFAVDRLEAWLRSAALLLLCCFCLSVGVNAQDKFRFSAVYQDSRIPLTERDDDVVKGFSAEADVRLFKLGKVRGSAAYNFQRLYNVEVYPFYFDGMNVVDLYRNVNTHYAGAQLGLDLGYAVEPFVGYFVGVNRVHEDAERQLTSKVRLGANVTFTKKSRFFVKAAIDFNRSYGSPNKPLPLPDSLPIAAGGFTGLNNRMVTFGAGFRF